MSAQLPQSRPRRSTANKGGVWASLVPSKKSGSACESDDNSYDSPHPPKKMLKKEFEENVVPSTPKCAQSPSKSLPKVVVRSTPKLVLKPPKKDDQPQGRHPKKAAPPELNADKAPVEKGSASQSPSKSPVQQAPTTTTASKTHSKANGVSGPPAMSKEKLADIEQEMRATFMSDDKDDDDYEYESLSAKSYGYNDDDDDFVDTSALTIRKGSPSDGPKKRGRPLGSKSTYTRRTERRVVIDQYGDRRVVSTLPRTIGTSVSQYQRINESRPIKVFMRPKTYVASAGPPFPVTQVVTNTKRDMTELAEKFKNRVVKGDSVQKFNEVIETLLDEIKLLSEDRANLVANHKETISQMTMAHTTVLDLKDSRIQQLENIVYELQQKNIKLSYKVQESCLEHNTEAYQIGQPKNAELVDSAEAAAEREALEEFIET